MTSGSWRSKRSRQPDGGPVLGRGAAGGGSGVVPRVGVVETHGQPPLKPPGQARLGGQYLRVRAAPVVAHAGELVVAVARAQARVDEGRQRVAEASRVRAGQHGAEVLPLEVGLVEVLE